MSLANFGEPVTLVRSPMFTKFMPGRIVSASRPLRRVCGSIRGGRRGGKPRTAWAMAWMCAGVVPQQPPTMFSQPSSAHLNKRHQTQKRQPNPALLKKLLEGKERPFAIERVEDGFHKKHVRPAVH